MADGKYLAFSAIISNTLSKLFMFPIPTDNFSLSFILEREYIFDCCDLYIDEGLEVEE